MILKKLVTLKLITLLLLCPFITYGMKRKRSVFIGSSISLVSTAEPSPKKVVHTPRVTPTKNSITSSTTPGYLSLYIPPAVQTKTKDIIKTLINTTLQRNDNKLICEHKDCDRAYVFKSTRGLSNHLRIHIPQFECSLCKKIIKTSDLNKEQNAFCDQNPNQKHQITAYVMNPEKEKELLYNFNIETPLQDLSTAMHDRAVPEIVSVSTTSDELIQDVHPQTTQLACQNEIARIPGYVLYAITHKIQQDNNGSFMCNQPHCNNHVYKDEQTFVAHLRNIHAQKFKCSLCNKIFNNTKASEGYCQKSENKKHRIANYPWTLERQQQLLREFGIETLNEYKLFNPLKIEHTRRLQAIIETLKKNKLICPYTNCNQQFNARNLEAHLLSHIKCFTCKECDKEFGFNYQTKGIIPLEPCTQNGGHFLFPNYQTIETDIKNLQAMCEAQENANAIMEDIPTTLLTLSEPIADTLPTDPEPMDLDDKELEALLNLNVNEG